MANLILTAKTQITNAINSAAQKAFEEMVSEVEAIRREQASSLIVPGGMGGKIHLP